MTDEPIVQGGESTADQPRVRILVVDDEPVIAALIADLFTRFDYDVVTRSSVAEATEALAGDPFDLCVTDYLLPDGTGLDVTEKAATLAPNLRFLLISAYLEPELALRVDATPAIVATLRKPMDIFELKNRADAVIEASADREPPDHEQGESATA